MNYWRLIAILAALVALGLAVALVTYTAPESPAGASDPNLTPVTVQLNDGRTVACVVFDPPGAADALWCALP